MDFLNNIEKMYVIHCVENEKRLENIKYQFEHNKIIGANTEIYFRGI